MHVGADALRSVTASRKNYDVGVGCASGVRYLTSDPIGILRDYSNPQLQVSIGMGMIEETDFAGEELNHTYGYVGQNPLSWFDEYGLAKNKNKGGFVNPNRRKGAEGRQKGGLRERNGRALEGEEHSIRPKGGFRNLSDPTPGSMSPALPTSPSNGSGVSEPFCRV